MPSLNWIRCNPFGMIVVTLPPDADSLDEIINGIVVSAIKSLPPPLPPPIENRENCKKCRRSSISGRRTFTSSFTGTSLRLVFLLLSLPST